MNLLNSLLGDRQQQYLLLIGAYRDNEVTPDPMLISLALYQDGMLFHGESFQKIQQVLNITTTRLTITCLLSPLADHQRQQFTHQTIDVIAQELQYQSLFIWVHHFHQAGSLPVSYQRSEHFQSIPVSQPFYVSTEVIASTSTKLVSNIVTHDAQRQLYSRILGAEVTLTPKLNRLFSSTDTKAIG